MNITSGTINGKHGKENQQIAYISDLVAVQVRWTQVFCRDALLYELIPLRTGAACRRVDEA